jgi:hypothetical protein
MVSMLRTFRSPFVRRFYSRWFLPSWFLVISASHLQNAAERGWVGVDAHIYYRGSAAWLAGTDPWSASAELMGAAFHYAGLPPTVIAFAPMTLLPESTFVFSWLIIGFLAAVYTVRRLHLSWYWLAFPPMVEGVLTGNPGIVILALLVTANPVANAVAAMLKVYAVLPLIGEARRRSIVAAAIILAATLAMFPLWVDYISTASVRTVRLMVEADGGYGWAGNSALLLMAAASMLVLARIDRRAAGWLVVPALWPASEFHYSTLALPVIQPILALTLAIPVHGVPALAVTAYVIWRVLAARLEGRLSGRLA